MRRISLAILVVAALAASYGLGRRGSHAPTGKPERRVLYYHDPMHPSYRSDRPGIAPDCSMALTPVYADDVSSGPAPVRVDSAQATAIGLSTEAARTETGTGEIRTVGRVQAEE